MTGLSGPDVPQIRDALTAAALQMTTLNVDIAKLEAAVSQYAYVHTLTVTSNGAHAVVIRVAEQVPVAFVDNGSSKQLVDADGAFLPSSTTVHGALPWFRSPLRRRAARSAARERARGRGAGRGALSACSRTSRLPPRAARTA